MNKEEEIVQNLRDIPWLSRCGAPLDIELTTTIVRISSWDEVWQALSSNRWEKATLESHNDLHEEARNRGKGPWNPAVRGYKPLVEAAIQENLVALVDHLELRDRLLNNIRWNLVGWAMERYFLGKRSGFFGDLFRLYQAGYLPCGWAGNWPGGALIVF